MAEHGVLSDAFFSIDANDLSAYVRSINVPQGAEANDDTAMGDTTRSSAPGLLTWSGSVEFNAEWAAVDAIIEPLLGTVVTIIWRPASGAASASNPSRTGSALVAGWDSVAGSVGDQAIMTLELASAGTLTRATT